MLRTFGSRATLNDTESGVRYPGEPEDTHTDKDSSSLHEETHDSQEVVGHDNEKPVEQQPPPADPRSNIVNWDGPNDPENPQNMYKPKKWFITMTYSLLTLTVTLSSSIFSAAAEQAGQEFHVSQEIMVLATSLFLVGFGIGPIVFA